MELLRLEAAQMSRIEQQTDMTEVLEGVFTLLGEQIQQHDLTICKQLDSALPSVAVDPRLMRQFLLALLSYLVEQAQNGILDCRLIDNGDTIQLIIVVSSAADIHQKSNSDRLAALNELTLLCHHVIESMNTDTQMAGFKVTLPIVQNHKTILVIDDNDDILELIQCYLQGNHFEVVTAKTAAQAFEWVKETKPAAIILDLMMPDRDGWDLLQFFQHQPATQPTPIIVCSVLRQKELALSLGATAFIEKPFSEQHLVSLLEQVIG